MNHSPSWADAAPITVAKAFALYRAAREKRRAERHAQRSHSLPIWLTTIRSHIEEHVEDPCGGPLITLEARDIADGDMAHVPSDNDLVALAAVLTIDGWHATIGKESDGADVLTVGIPAQMFKEAGLSEKSED